MTGRAAAAPGHGRATAQGPWTASAGGRPPWFGRKRIGVGWSPRAWPRYLTTTVFIVAIEGNLVSTRAGWTVYLVAAGPLVLFGLGAAVRQLARRSAADRRS